MSNIKTSMKIISGSSHPAIGEEIALCASVPLTPVHLDRFANGEINVRILESVRGDDVFIVQSHAEAVNDSILEQAILIDSAKRASAGSITAVCPFMAYARQDRKSNGREPISARLMIDILANAGADRIMTVDLHTGQIQGFMDGPFDHLIARPVLVDYLRENFSKENLVIVSPDAGRVKSSERYSNELDCELAIIHKHRSANSKKSAVAKHLIGDVEGRVCIIVDDMIDTAGTLCSAADLLMQNGADRVIGVATHGLFSGPAKERIMSSAFEKIIVTNTLPQDSSFKKLEILSVAPLIASSIKAVYSGDSVSALFNDSNQF